MVSWGEGHLNRCDLMCPSVGQPILQRRSQQFLFALICVVMVLVKLYNLFDICLDSLNRHWQPNNDSESPYDNQKQASDVAAILKEFSITNPIFVAWSYGMLISADYMSIYSYKDVCGVVVSGGFTRPSYVKLLVRRIYTHPFL